MKKLIISILILSIFGMFLVSAVGDYKTFYKIGMNYNKGAIEITSTDIEFSNEELADNFGKYSMGIMDDKNALIDTVYFGVPNEILYDNINPETGEIDSGGNKTLDEVQFEIYAPYYANAKEIIVYNDKLVELDKIEAWQYSKDVDRNKIISGAGEVPIEEQPEEEIPAEEGGLMQYWWVLLIALVVLGVVFWNSLKKK